MIRLLPVMDLMRHQVVRGVAGRRHEYLPVNSRLASDAQPATIAHAFASRCGFQDVYVADLDALGGSEPDWPSYEQIASAGLQLIIDAGVKTAAHAQRLADFAERNRQITGIVIASESVLDEPTLRTALEILGPRMTIFSLDLRNGTPIVAQDRWKKLAPLQLVDEVVLVGCQRLIVLDLAAVGCGGGPATGDLCRLIRAQHPSVEIVSGGGVRDAAEVQQLVAAGCDRVLVASALHDGRLDWQ